MLKVIATIPSVPSGKKVQIGRGWVGIWTKTSRSPLFRVVYGFPKTDLLELGFSVLARFGQNFPRTEFPGRKFPARIFPVSPIAKTKSKSKSKSKSKQKPKPKPKQKNPEIVGGKPKQENTEIVGGIVLPVDQDR